MPDVVSVCGPLPAGQLGFCQCHEHLCIENSHCAGIDPNLCIDDPARTLEDLQAFKQAGGDTILDAQGMGCGRNAKTLQMLSVQSGVSIIASTGFHKMLFYPKRHWMRTTPQDKLASLFVSELTEGMFLDADTAYPKTKSNIRAGFIKTALDVCGLDPLYAGCFMAAANAAKQTGACLMVHTEAGSNPLALSAFLGRQGLPPQKVIFCHLDRTMPDLTIHRHLARQGHYLEYDTIARPKYHDNAHEIKIIKTMLDEGFAQRLLMSLDVTRARLQGYGGHPGLSYILNTFIPLLQEAGVDANTIELIFRQNPARVLATPHS